jgi:D-psicose/D-tagatose/L-ribulose 3-epimerase
MAIGIGISTWVWTSPLSNDQLHLLKKIKQMGFDCAELPIEDPKQFDYEKVDAAIKESGVRPLVCGAFGPDRDLTHEDPAIRENSLNYIRACLPLCERWGAKVLPGPMYSGVGKRRHLPADARKKEWDLAVAGLRKAAAMARDFGVTLAVEPLNRFETDLVNTVEQGIRMCGDVNEKNVGLLLDTFHMNIEEKDIYSAVRSAGSLVKHVHTCENDRGAPGSGLVAWDDLARALKEIDYQGDCVIESFTPELRTIAGAAAIWRPLANSQDELARDGLEFLRRLLK